MRKGEKRGETRGGEGRRGEGRRGKGGEGEEGTLSFHILLSFRKLEMRGQRDDSALKG